ncbi:CopG family transcriptional regulator [Ramlibacter sp. WS9]|uniref:CopG family transcriptional regulator n=1 Tax=Ramlibacter sp. WS9 TaxID=1882741 RepID=UPI0011432464|nr:CopG family transcriptional regulator [Ramlibacter sp. WS9]ROZ78421.1 CopG family transcriptional regulator [Ramlibacter sp. WS9]
MELKTARLTVLIDPAKKKALEDLCAMQDMTPSQLVRSLIRTYLAENSVSFVPSGSLPKRKSGPNESSVASPKKATRAKR